MGRIGLALALLIGWMSLADADDLRSMPQVTQLRLSMDGETAIIALGGTFGADTATIRVSTSSGNSIETTPDQLVVESTALAFRDHEHVTVVTCV